MFKTHIKNQHPRSDLPRQIGKSLMALSARRAGNGPANPNPRVPAPAFVQKKIKESTQHA